MNKKIKIIELLNKIANGEKLPKKIIFLNETLEYDIDCQDYKGCSKTGSGAFFAYLFTNEPTQNFINGRVEILEDNTEEIEELEKEIEQQAKEIERKDRNIHKLNLDKIHQQKEIEELKEDNKHQWEERCKLTFELENSISKDKIKPIQIIDLDGKIHNVYKIKEE